MKIRPQRKAGLQVSLSKKFYQRSTSQTQQQIKKIQCQNAIKKQMIQRMTAELQNLQKFLNQTYLSRQTQKKNQLPDNAKNQLTNNAKNSMSTIKTQRNSKKNVKSNNSIHIKINQMSKSPQPKTISPKGFTRSQSACKHSSKANSNQNSFTSVKRNNSKCIEQQQVSTKQQSGIKSQHELKQNCNKKLSTIRAKKDENYVKYLECRLRQLAKEVKMQDEAQLKIQKGGMRNSKRT